METDWLTPFLVEYQERTRQALAAKDPGRAADAYLEFLRYEPAEIQVAPNGVPATSEDRQVAKTFGEIHAVCARLLTDAGRQEQARVEAERAKQWLELAGR